MKIEQIQNVGSGSVQSLASYPPILYVLSIDIYLLRTTIKNMILVKNFYIKDYVFEIQMYDDVRDYVNEHSYAWRSYKIEVEYREGNLKSIHLISMPIIPEGVLIEKYGKHHKPPYSNTGVENP